ncbi:MAG: radical SAM protein [Paludibacteraceae bacterium]|nr:radical SAM protein [Paludibacteraceae bacterium]
MALVRKIIAQSTVDGPGNRTAVFLQGCNIRCAYCHNPETQSLHDDEAKEMTAREVFEVIRKSVPFIRGITISGGECMLQTDFLEQLINLTKTEALTALIDSNGTIPFSQHRKLLDLCDGVMLDVKAWDKKVYQQLTQATNDAIVKDNLELLAKENKLAEVRIVCLPKSSPIQTDIENILQHIAQHTEIITSNVPVYLIRYRPYGVITKLKDQPATPDYEMQHYLQLAQSLYLNARI